MKNKILFSCLLASSVVWTAQAFAHHHHHDHDFCDSYASERAKINHGCYDREREVVEYDVYHRPYYRPEREVVVVHDDPPPPQTTIIVPRAPAPPPPDDSIGINLNLHFRN